MMIYLTGYSSKKGELCFLDENVSYHEIFEEVFKNSRTILDKDEKCCWIAYHFFIDACFSGKARKLLSEFKKTHCKGYRATDEYRHEFIKIDLFCSCGEK